MTTIDPTQAVQTGVWALLSSDPQIKQTITNVLDEMPELNSREYPFIAVPDPVSEFSGTHDDPGRKVRLRIHTYTKGDTRTDNYRPENLVGARIMELLDRGQHLAFDPYVEDHTVWMIRHIESRKMNEMDRSVRHRVDTVDIWVSNSTVQ
jgi:hypothetical protein